VNKEKSGAKKVPKGYRESKEQLAYGRLLDKKQHMLSPAAHYVLEQARSEGGTAFGTTNYRFQPQKYREAAKKMGRVTDELTGEDRVLLSKIARAALVAAASLDTDDPDKCVWERAWLGKLYWMYRTEANMLGDVLREKVAEEHRKATGRDSEAPR
jgi:hypothetical protein